MKLKTDWKNYRQLKEGEIIKGSDQSLTSSKEGWDEVATRRIGTPAPCPLYSSHTIFRRRISLENKEKTRKF
jgi:hypothetical protein